MKFRPFLLAASLVASSSPAVTPMSAEACGPEGTLQAVRRSPEMVSWQLLGRALGRGGNPAFSGLSLAGALALAKAGATGDVAAELQRLLGVPPEVECGPAALAGAWKATVDDLKKADASVTWKLATGAWLSPTIAPKKLWTAVATGEFGATIEKVDFVKKPVHTLVNGWVKRQTDGKIESILPEPLDKETIFVLANALYFDAAWSEAFAKEQTTNVPFHGLDGEAPVPMMAHRGNFAYASDENGQVVRLPYGKARAFELAVWLPPKDKLLQESLTENGRKALGALLDKAEPANGTVKLPRFRVDASSPNLAEVLADLGAKKPFAFTRDWTLLAPEREVRLSRVAHRVVVDVSERGTTVAAATAVVGATRGAPLAKPFEFTADRPFVYVLRHRPTNVWLAVGMYKTP